MGRGGKQKLAAGALAVRSAADEFVSLRDPDDESPSSSRSYTPANVLGLLWRQYDNCRGKSEHDVPSGNWADVLTAF